MIATSLPDSALQVVWEKYALQKEERLREQLLLHYLPLVKVVAGRMKVGMPGSVEYDDLVSTGLMGLMNSIENFSPERGFKFETFAVPRIRGAILDGLRDVDWAPRSVRQKGRRLEQAIEKLTVELGRLPHDQEIANELGLEGDEYSHFMEQAGAAPVISLDVRASDRDEDDGGALHEVVPDNSSIDPLLELEQKDARDIAKQLISQLSEQERSVVALYYYEELTFKEIGQVLNVSESRICQIHTKVLATLRTRMKKVTD